MLWLTFGGPRRRTSSVWDLVTRCLARGMRRPSRPFAGTASAPHVPVTASAPVRTSAGRNAIAERLGTPSCRRLELHELDWRADAHRGDNELAVSCCSLSIPPADKEMSCVSNELSRRKRSCWHHPLNVKYEGSRFEVFSGKLYERVSLMLTGFCIYKQRYGVKVICFTMMT